MLVGEIERHKLIWRKIGDWMDTANSEDALPEFPDFGYSTSEKKLIAAILQATSEKRLELIKLEMRVIESFHPDYRWSDLIAYPDVQKSIKESVGFSEETWISGVLPLLLQIRPSSVAIRLLQSMEMIKKSSNEGFIKIGLETMENLYVSEQQKASEAGSHAVIKRHENSKETKDLKEIEKMWKEWRIDADPEMRYENNGDFARNVVTIFPAVKESTVVSHCSSWAKEYGYKSKKGRPKKA